MLSQRRLAQLGVGAASLTLVTCMTVLVAGARDNSSSSRSNVAPVLSETHVTTVNNPVSLQSDAGSSVTLASSKQ